MDIIPVILGTVKYNKIIKSRIPSNAPHALVPLKRSKRWYRSEDYASTLFLHDFAGGVNLFFGTPEFRKVKCSDKQLQTPTKTTVLQREVAISQEKQLKSACNDWSGGAVSISYRYPYEIDTKNSPRKKGKNVKKVKSYEIGFDTEYVQEGTSRRLLSYQFSIYANDTMYAWICLPRNGRRLPLHVLLSWFLADMNEQGLGFSYSESNDIWLVCHFGSVDYTTLDNFEYVMESSDSLRKTIVSIEKPVFLKIWDKTGHSAVNKIFLRDTTLLAPAGSSLEALGKVLGITKVDIPQEYSKSRMDEFLVSDPKEFLLYACIDPVVTLYWFMSVKSFLNINKVPVTIASHGANYVKKKVIKIKGWKSRDFESRFLGRTKTVEEKGNGRAKSTQEWKNTLSPAMDAAAQSYYGGRNECFMYGIHKGPWYDYDLSGAYSIAMEMLKTPDYENLTIKTDLNEIDLNCYVAVDIEFEFPSNTAFPCLPVRDPEGRGLVFPLTGRTWASAPEIVLARKMGAKLKLATGGYYHVPMLEECPFGEAVKDMIENRERAKAEYGSKSVPDLLWKEMINSTYGKLGQGLRDKRAFSTRKKATQPTPFSPITQPFLASYITSFIRATATGSMEELRMAGYRIASVTTDGFLSDAPPEVVFNLSAYGFGDIYREKRLYVAGKDDMFEIKHRAEHVVIFTTRGCFGVGEIWDKDKDGKDKLWELPQAKAGYYFKGLEGDFKSKEDKHNRETEYLAALFLSRDGKVSYTKTILPSLRDYLLNKKELAHDETKEIKWEFDFKRKPDVNSAHEEALLLSGKYYTHLSFETIPWESHEEFNEVRSYRDDHISMYLPLKEKRSLERVLFYAFNRKAVREAGYYVRDRNSDEDSEILKPFILSLLGAYLNGDLSNPWRDETYETIANEVNRLVKETYGYDVSLSVNDLKNAKRRYKGLIESNLMQDLRKLFEGGMLIVADSVGANRVCERQKIRLPTKARQKREQEDPALCEQGAFT